MEPQLAVALKPDKLHKYEHYAMEPKLDGIRCVAYKDSVGRVSLTSRGGKDLTAKVPHIVSWLESLMPHDYYFDGELGYVLQPEDAFFPILDFNMTTRVLGSGVEVSLYKQNTIRIAENQWIKYYVFDAPNRLLPESERRLQLKCMFRTGYQISHPVVLIHRMDGFDQRIYDDYVLRGGEGIMLKNPDAFYDPGGRHANNWYKLKKFDTTDGLICDFKEGQGKYVGMCGALLVLTEDEQLFWCAGMDDAWRHEFWKNAHKYQGKKVEVKHFGLTAGTPRFPQFLRMRSDLD